jgi:DUF1365 family protein
MESCIYEGIVRHRRLLPKPHEFSYRLFQVYLDLAEIDAVFELGFRRIWSNTGRAIAEFRRSDYLGDPGTPLDQAVRDLVESRTGTRPEGPIRLLTNLRYFGYCMNPVSFYYCFDQADSSPDVIVAEITNTPWGERHCYVLDERRNSGTRFKKHYRFGKDFHISPFMAMDLDYAWSFTKPGKALGVHMSNFEKGDKIFDATLSLKRKEMSARSLVSTLLSFPFMTGKVITAIYFNALLLWLKRIPFHTHPAKIERSLEVSE